MRLVSARLQRWSAPVQASNARGSWSQREGVLLRLEDEDGRVGWGEASPLPGYSRETLGDCIAALEAHASRATEIVYADLGPPAANFALETALLDIESQRLGMPLARLLGAAPDARLEVSALLPGLASDAWQEAAARALHRGIRVLKAKVGAPGRLEEELLEIEKLRSRFGERLTLRLDANGVLADETLPDALKAFARLGIELVEEPSPCWLELDRSPVPLAADETLAMADGEERVLRAIDRGLVSVVVLKPALLGLRRSLELAQHAKQRGAGIIVTHLFDGPVGRAAAAAIALAVCDGTLACGLEGALPGRAPNALTIPDLPGVGVLP